MSSNGDNMDTDKKMENTNDESKETSPNGNGLSSSHSPKVLPWWQGGGIIPESGKDMGVWEKSLEDQANFFHVWSLSFLNPLLRLGSHKVLDSKDIGVPSTQDLAHPAFQAVHSEWLRRVEQAERHNAPLREAYQKKCQEAAVLQQAKPTTVPEPRWKEPSVMGALITSFGGWRIALAMLYYVASAVLTFAPVLILNDLVRYFEHYTRFGDDPKYDGYAGPRVEVFGLALFPVLVSILQTRHQAIMAHCSVFVRTAISMMLHHKALKVSAAGRAKTSTGQVVNMMSNDTMQLQRFLQFLGLTMCAPLQIGIALYLIHRQVGSATWVGVGYMFFLIPIQLVIFMIVGKMRIKVLSYSDQRVKMMNEILTGIRVIKFYAWEVPFGKEVGRLRQKELDALTKLAYTAAIGFSIILLSTPIIQPILVFITYVNIQDEPLTAATAFTTVALFNIMRFPFAFMPMGLLQYIQSRIALKRLERYLSLPELSPYVKDSPPPDTPEDSPFAKPGSISIENGFFSWIDPDAAEIKPVQEEKPKRGSRSSRRSKKSDDGEASEALNASTASSKRNSNSTTGTTNGEEKEIRITLQNITCQIEAGSLVAVVGQVGSGKSSFLSALLGEMESIQNSKVYTPGCGTNVEGSVSYCTQSPWVVNETLRGNVLFGREYDEARYNEVLDCCALRDDIAILPAGDMTEIGERGINLSGGQKARVSLARALYGKATRLLLLDDPLSAVDAHVAEHLFSEAISGPIAKDMTRVLVTHHVHVLHKCDKVIMFEDGQIKHIGAYQELVDRGVDFAGAVDVSRAKQSSEEEAENEKTDVANGHKAGEPEAVTATETEKLKKAGENLVTEEEREEGDVSMDAYSRYARAGGICIVIAFVIIQSIGRGCELGASFWLAHWTSEMSLADISGEPFTDQEVSRYAGIYALFGVLGVVGLGFRGIFLAKHRLHASKYLHDGITESVLKAPVAFFDVTPIGRILNRFAADMDKVDLELSQTIAQGSGTLFSVLGAVGAIIASTKGTFLVPLVPISYAYYLIQKWFRKSSTELQRVTSVANSPIFADFSQTLSGTATIRAYGAQVGFFDSCRSSFDTMNASYILVQLTNYWLSLRLDVIGGLIAAFVGGIAVGTLKNGFIPTSWLGLSLSYAIEMTTYLKFGVQMIARLEADMSSVERILHYADKIEPEAPNRVPEKDPDEGSWPSKGEIEFSHMSMRYREGPLVLKDLTFKVKGGEKIGVCGRTGSGKSSLMIALFRVSEIENDEGKILIDGVNTREIGTSSLRLNLSIIPQDPVLFSNTVRYNLDPFGTKTDNELWEVLDKVRLGEAIRALSKELDEEIAEGGENFSQGQRQLLCIGRSLLRNPKVLVMDEATASIDNETDAMIQTMIRDNFRDATVLTIAHRLNTIMDSDRVLVLDDGKIAELDTPAKLMAKDKGHFKAMVEKSRAAQGRLD
eukprot:Nitzschia sp. Nitz4//scaffold175_size95217//10753//15087//NITZ4_004718-RA/size95217-processed-gene-0.45-mRNA-1//1//CDS//3329538924//8766//frame0